MRKIDVYIRRVGRTHKVFSWHTGRWFHTGTLQACRDFISRNRMNLVAIQRGGSLVAV